MRRSPQFIPSAPSEVTATEIAHIICDREGIDRSGVCNHLARIGSADQNSVRAQAEAELARVIVDVDSANIMYSPADNGLGRGVMNVEEISRNTWPGARVFQEGKYAEALQHLHKADDIIRAQPDWTEGQ
jgi:hypothetical protein